MAEVKTYSDNIEKVYATTPTRPDDDVFGHGEHIGLNKREYFAGLAMQSLATFDMRDNFYEEIARRSVIYADALITALNNELS